MSQESVKLCFLVTSNIIICYTFPENFIEIHQVSQKILIFTSLTITIYQFFGLFLPLFAKKINEVNIYKIISAVFLTWNYFR